MSIKRILISFVCLVFGAVMTKAQCNNHFKDKRYTYLWDVTLSMKGYAGAPNIYDEVVKVLIADIESITNEREEIVVVAFQDTKYCEIWREKATAAGKKNLKSKIKAYRNDKVTHTNISAPLQYAIDEIFTPDRIDIMKLLTDGYDNVDPQKLQYILDNWCDMAQDKDVYGYYVLLTDAAHKSGMSFILKDICRFEEIDAAGPEGMNAVNEIRQINVSALDCVAMVINVRDEYNKSKRIKFLVDCGKEVAPGYKVHFKTRNNPYFEIDEVATMDANNSFELHPKFKKPQAEIMAEQWEERHDIILELKPETTDGPHKFTRLLDDYTFIKLINKPEKTVIIDVL